MENLKPMISCHRYRPSAVLKVTGEDAFLFLQGQFTQDLQPCLKGESFAYGLWLNQKGKVLGDSFVLRSGDSWLCMSVHSAADVIRERLEAYVIADDVTIEDVTSSWTGMAAWGEAAGEALVGKVGRIPTSPSGLIETAGGFIFEGRRAKGPSWEWLYPAVAEAATAGLGASEVGFEDMERLRIAAGIPSVPRDIGPEDLPNEGGLERDAISYSKGCYLGQEVMARLKTMGQVRRRLMVVEGSSALPAKLPATLFADGKKLGELRSAVRMGDGFIGLAMISLLAMTGRPLLSFSPEGVANIVIKNER